MSRLDSIEELVERLTEKVDVLLSERKAMYDEIAYLRARLEEQDKTEVRAFQAMQIELENVQRDSLYLEQGRVRIESKLQGLNDRLINLVENRYRG